MARLVQIAMNAWDDSALGRFWAEALGWSVSSEEPGVTSPEPVGFTFPDPVAVCIDIIAVPEPKTVKHRVHIGLATTSAAHQATLVARFLDFGTMLAAVGGPALGDGGDHREGVVGGAAERALGDQKDAGTGLA